MRPPAGYPVVHLELHTGDLAGARALYGELCGWRQEQVETGRGPYLALEMGRRIGGGIVECNTGRPLWLPYVEVVDIDAVTERAHILGVRVLLDRSESRAGWRTVIASDRGGEMAFWQPKVSCSPVGERERVP